MYQTILNILLTIMVLASSNGIAINKHYCGGQVKDIALFKQAKSCTESCHKSANEEKGSCCNHEHTYIEGVDLKVLSAGAAHLLPIASFADILLGFVQLQDVFIAEKIQLEIHTRPPPLVRYLPVLFQSFLL